MRMLGAMVYTKFSFPKKGEITEKIDVESWKLTYGDLPGRHVFVDNG